MDDWQDSALSNRHLHNKVGKTGRVRGRGKSSAVFDVKKAFGTYEIDCPALSILASKAKETSANAIEPKPGQSLLEIYRLNESGEALIAEVVVVGLFRMSVVMTGSRKVMAKVMRSLVEANVLAREDEGQPADKDEASNSGHPEDGDNGEQKITGDQSSSDDEEHQEQQDRFKTFEKNSFRSPKFWLKWQANMNDGKIVAGTGYFVFTGNDCRRFDGTLSCYEFEWDHVKIKGRKSAARSERDHQLAWLIAEDNDT